MSSENRTEPSDEIAISVRNLTKTYRLFEHPGDRIKQFISFGIKRYHREFTALRDISFDIKRGETIGIIGKNGSGKSTLLQLICGILKPTAGTVQVNGRVSALLELGAGFNPEFTGRENVYFQGALTGFKKTQMDERFDTIAAFADIGEFIDQPVRTYSSGMFVRLAFSTAIHIDPEILVVDEALAVGDSEFQAKCLKRIDAIRKQGGTILIVTHALEQVAHHCDRALLLDHGKLDLYSVTNLALARYIALLQKTPLQQQVIDRKIDSTEELRDLFAHHPGYLPQETRWGDKQAIIEDILITQSGRCNPETLVPCLKTEIQLQVRFHSHIEQPIYGLAVKSKDGAILFAMNSEQLLAPTSAPPQRAGDVASPCFTFLPILAEGVYYLSIGVASNQNATIIPHDRRYDSVALRIAMPDAGIGKLDMEPSFHVLQGR